MSTDLQACVDVASREAAQSLAKLEAVLGRHRDEAGWPRPSGG